MAGFDDIIDELYALPLDEFTKRRNASAKGSEEAQAIKALTKPSVAAWAVNLLARADRLGPVLDLGDRMRVASAGELRDLAGERRDVVAGAVRAAAELADEAGHPISESVQREVDTTLQAALRDADAAAAVASGRLVRSIEPGGFGEVDLDGAVAGEAPATRTAKPTEKSAKDDEAAAADKARRRELDEAQGEAEVALAALETAMAERDDLRARLDDAEERLAEVQRTVDAVRAEIGDLDDESAAADRTVRDAERRARRAKAALDGLATD